MKRVLLVEDESGLARTVSLRLEKNGYRVIHADTKAAALALLERIRPDLVVLDLLLPDGSGFEVMAKLRVDQRLEAIPVIALTALDEREMIEWGFASGANAYITKPFESTRLIEAVRMLLDDVSGRPAA